MAWANLAEQPTLNRSHRESLRFGDDVAQLTNEREKLLRAYYADTIDVAILKRE